ncbi:MAG: hypothetical protein RLZ51_45 [Pseudomonadota bacterium]|jgi:hypothetical protein
MPLPADLKPCGAPGAWRGSVLKHQADRWVLRLDAADNAELRAAVSHAQSLGAAIPGLNAAQFPLPRLAPRLASMLHELLHGQGFLVIEGFALADFSLQEAALAYWGIGAHLGRGRAQNAQGELLGHVTDLGVDYRNNPNVRGYQTALRLPFHNDSADLVGLLCLRTARTGGLSRIVSSKTLHDVLLERHPDVLATLYEPFHMDRRGEAPAGKLPYYSGPCFEWVDGRLFCRYNRSFIESAQRFAEVPRLTDAQKRALQVMDDLCADPELHLDMALQPGSMQFLCNYSVLHSRTAYEDFEDRDQRRYLLRLWLDTGRIPHIPASWADRFEDMDLWQRNPQPPIFDHSIRREELAH